PFVLEEIVSVGVPNGLLTESGGGLIAPVPKFHTWKVEPACPRYVGGNTSSASAEAISMNSVLPATIYLRIEVLIRSGMLDTKHFTSDVKHFLRWITGQEPIDRQYVVVRQVYNPIPVDVRHWSQLQPIQRQPVIIPKVDEIAVVQITAQKLA